MNLTLTSVKYGDRIDSTKSWIHPVVNIDGTDREFNYTAPSGLFQAELEAYCSARLEKYSREIYRNLYPDAPDYAKQSTDAFEAWIAAGRWVNEGTPEAYQATLQPWKGAHPVLPVSLGHLFDPSDEDKAEYQRIKQAANTAGESNLVDFMVLMKNFLLNA